MAARTGAKPVEAEANGEDFTFTYDGKDYTLPAASRIKAGILRKAIREGRSDEEQIFIIIEGIADEDALSAIDDMTSSELQDLFMEWRKHSGVDLGE